MWKERKNCASEKLLRDFSGEEYLVLYKREEQIFMKKVSPNEFLFLEKLKQGYSLEKTFDLLSLEEGEVTQLFSFIAQSGIVSSLAY